MFEGVRRRLTIFYAIIMTATLLLLGPVLYLSFAHQMADASDATLRLAAQRQAALALLPNSMTLGINPRFQIPSPLAQRDTFYLLLTSDGRLRTNPARVQHAGLPDVAAARQAARTGFGVLSTLPTPDAGDIRLFTVPILRGHRVMALLQAGHSLVTLASAQRSLLLFLSGLGAAAVLAAAIGGLVLTGQAMRPINAAFAAQRAFVADASHELRTPLTLIRTNAEVLLEAGAIPDPEDRTLVEDIVAESEHMGRLISDLLMLARLDTGVLQLDQTPVHLDVLIATCCRQMARLAERRGVQLVCGPAAPLVVRGDAGRLEQVLLILLDNAIKYNTVHGSVEVTLRREGGQAVLAVRDTGRGIPASELPHLFARFHRGPAAGLQADGSGLGLAIATGIARAHHGRLQVQSEQGTGSTFMLLLPLAGRPGVDQIAARAHATEQRNRRGSLSRWRRL